MVVEPEGTKMRKGGRNTWEKLRGKVSTTPRLATNGRRSHQAPNIGKN
jgi:hypothetical protein